MIVLVLDAAWFGLAFWFFALVPTRAAAILVPRSARASSMFRTLAASVRFLGGMNLALAAFAVSILLARQLFPDPRQIVLFLAVFSFAHATQFLFNLPVLHARSDTAMWPVTRGPMLFIFVVDGTLAVANMACAFALAM
jgi:hypothetical protein